MDYSKNYVLTNEQVQQLIQNKIINPFVPKGEDGITPIYVLKQEDIKLIGEGGLGSGKKLKLSEAEIKARRKEQLKNAQRVYREKNRVDYNKKQNEYYYDMKKDEEKYSNWKDKMSVANQTYRAKKKLQTGKTSIIKKIEKQLKKEWKEDPKNKGKKGRPKLGETKVKKEMDKAWFEAEKQKRVQEELKKLGEEYVIPKQKVEGKFDTDGRQVYKKFDIDLKKDPIYPYTGDMGKGDIEPYTEADYIEYKTTKLIPPRLKKEIKKKKKVEEKKENIEMVIEEVKPVKKDKDPIIYKDKTLSELNESERKAYDYITEKNKDQTGSNIIPYSKIPQIISIRKF
jgi:hypothetical protein